MVTSEGPRFQRGHDPLVAWTISVMFYHIDRGKQATLVQYHEPTSFAYVS